MKVIFSIVILLLFATICYGQLLEGSWKGSYTIDYNGRTAHSYSPIELNFILTNDTSYAVYSYSSGHSKSKVADKIKCKVHYELFAKDSIYLEEIEIAEPLDANPRCMKKIYLKVKQRKKRVLMVGQWHSIFPGCDTYGTIRFSRKK